MDSLESKLADWFKYVDRQAEAVRHKESPQVEEEPVQPEEIISQVPLRQAPEAALGVGGDAVAAEPRRLRDLRRTPPPEILEEPDIPEIEDFLPFLKEPQPQRPAPPAEAPAAPVSEPQTQLEPGQPDPESQRSLFASEGTGTPRPRPQQPSEPAPEPPTRQPQPGRPASRAVIAPAELAADEKEMWHRLPKHIQLLLGEQHQESAQSSYKEFKETRQEMIHRLLDPPLSLEEAARILNVCPTTVRRYTNRGFLPHFRTAGNQRRFRLSDVLSFMESHYDSSRQESHELRDQ